MAISPAPDVPPQIKETRVIDQDIHFGPSSEDLRPYVDDEMVRKELRRIDESLHRSWRGHPQTTQTLNPPVAATGEDTGEVSRPRTGEDVVGAAAKMGVDIPIVAPELFYLPTANYPVLMETICQAYNDYILDNVVTADEAVKAWALLPQWDPDAMVAELDRIGDEPDIVGAYAFFEHSHKTFGATDYDPVYDRLTDLGLPLCIHGSRHKRTDTPEGETMKTFSEGMGIHWAGNAMMQMGQMINGGVFDKFPDLQVLVQETGFTWVPFFVQHFGRLQAVYGGDIKLTPRMYEMDRANLARDLEDYVFGNFYFDTQPFSLTRDQDDASALLRMCRASERLTFSSDWPHNSIDRPADIADHPAITPDLQDAIFHENLEACVRL